jgi:hypothetical protein
VEKRRVLCRGIGSDRVVPERSVVPVDRVVPERSVVPVDRVVPERPVVPSGE